MSDLLNEMKGLIRTLNEAGKAYYQEARELMSNFEYDALYDRLVELEKLTGTVMADSPTIHVGYEVLSDLPKENHVCGLMSSGDFNGLTKEDLITMYN